MFPFTLNQLRILKAVAMEQNFTKAASKLYLSQPSLSKQIGRLEKNLGICLVKRQANTITLTRNGKLLLRYSNRILALCEESCRILANTRKDNYKNHKKGLWIGFDQTSGIYLCPKILTLFTNRDLYFSLTIVINSTKNIVQQIFAQKLDLTLTNEEVSEFLNEVTCINMEPYVNNPFYLTLPNSQFFAKRTVDINPTSKKVRLSNLTFFTLFRPRIVSVHIIRILQINKIDTNQFKTVIQLNSFEDLKIAVKLGLGLAILPGLAMDTEIKLKWVKIMHIPAEKEEKKLVLLYTFAFTDKIIFKILYDKIVNLKKS